MVTLEFALSHEVADGLARGGQRGQQDQAGTLSCPLPLGSRSRPRLRWGSI